MSARHQLQLKLAPWALLSVAAAWGMAFVVMKDAIERQSVNNFLFTRFSLAVVVMILIRPQTVKHFNKDLLQRGGLAGVFLGLGYIAQTLGLARTGAAHHDDVRLFNLHFVFADVLQKAFVVVKHGHGKVFLGVVLPDDILVEKFFDFLGLGQIFLF
mgnify:CR=1 FL=1